MIFTTWSLQRPRGPEWPRPVKISEDEIINVFSIIGVIKDEPVMKTIKVIIAPLKKDKEEKDDFVAFRASSRYS